MTVKKWIFSLGSLFALACSMLQGHSSSSSSHHHHHHNHNKVVKYVQGGACYSGEGTKHSPYATLGDAEADTSWDILVVLPSTVALDGGITLRPGTKLLGGGCDPTDVNLPPNQPTITNTSDATNGGNGVVVTGDAVIGNIHIKDTWASAINFDDGRDLYVKQVLITGHNQGEVLTPIAMSDPTLIEVAGIQGQAANDGTTRLEKVVIRNNHTGSGVINVPYAGAKRKLHVNKCEIAELTGANTYDNPDVEKAIIGIGAVAIGEGSELDVKIKNSYLHDFQAQASSLGENEAIVCEAIDGAKVRAHIRCCSFYKIHNSNQRASWHIIHKSATNESRVAPGVQSDLKLSVSSCTFEEPAEYAELQVTAVQNQTDNGHSKWVVKNCNIKGVYDTFVSFLQGSGREKISLLNNTASGFEGFFLAITEDSQNSISDPYRSTEVFIKGNNYVGGQSLGAIGVVPNFDGNPNPWDRLRICAEDNCFDGQGSGFAALLGYDFGFAGAGNADIRAHKNSFVGYNFDILDNYANVNYYAQKNWWGQGPSCTYGADCAPTQSCSNGQCTGPDNVVNLGTGTYNVKHPLNASIKCPGKCHTLLQGEPQFGFDQNAATEDHRDFQKMLAGVKQNLQTKR